MDSKRAAVAFRFIKDDTKYGLGFNRSRRRHFAIKVRKKRNKKKYDEKRNFGHG